MDIEQTYKQLTGVDLEAQRRIWDERAIGYYGEFLVFSELYRNIPGNCKILMNLEIPVTSNSRTEIDLLLIDESGLYVFEVKHYKGTIYGRDTDSVWTQYFRTAPNRTFKNPMQQNGYHVRALSKFFPELPIYSMIVFTNDECDIRVTNSNPNVDICSLKDLWYKLTPRCSHANKFLSTNEIDGIFTQLVPYSKLQEPVYVEGKAAPFYTWLQPAIDALNSQIQSIKEEERQYEQAEIARKQEYDKKVFDLYQKDRSARKKNILIGVACVLALVISVFLIHQGYKLAIENNTAQLNDAKQNYLLEIEKNTAELNKFKQNFLHVDQIGNPYIDDLSSYVNVSDVTISPLTDDAVNFSGKLAMANDTYCIQIAEDSKFIVMTTSGQFLEYNVFGEQRRYDAWSNRIFTMEHSLPTIQLYGINDIAQISYIKLTEISLLIPDTWGDITIAEDLEIELYDVNK